MEIKQIINFIDKRLEEVAQQEKFVSEYTLLGNTVLSVKEMLEEYSKEQQRRIKNEKN